MHTCGKHRSNKHRCDKHRSSKHRCGKRSSSVDLPEPSTNPSFDLLNTKPIVGMNYEPAPSNYDSLPPPPVYFDTDFWNADFPALWGTMKNDPSGTGTPRNDLQVMQSIGINMIKGYNYSDPNSRNHIPFLDDCISKNIKVIIPISNFFVSPNGINQFSAVIHRIINQAIQSDAVTTISIGNELQGVDNAKLIAQIFKFVVVLDSGNKLALCSPLQLFDSTGTTFPVMANQIRTEIVNLGLSQEYESRWFHGINIYPPTPIVTFLQTHKNDPVNGKQPLLFTEYGYWSRPTGQNLQKNQIVNQATIIYSNIDNTFPMFLGGCLFELTDELWKRGGFGDQQEQSFGIEKFTGNFGTDITTTGLEYRVDVLEKKESFDAFKNVPK